MLNRQLCRCEKQIYTLDNSEKSELFNHNIPLTIEPNNKTIYIHNDFFQDKKYSFVFTIENNIIMYHGIILSEILDILQTKAKIQKLEELSHVDAWIIINKNFRFIVSDLDVNELNKLLDILRD